MIKLSGHFFFREPFQSVSYSDAKGLDKATLPKNWTLKPFMQRARPSRPIFIKLPSGKYDLDFPENLATQTGNVDFTRLLLTHHMHYKGLRKVNKNISTTRTVINPGNFFAVSLFMSITGLGYKI